MIIELRCDAWIGALMLVVHVAIIGVLWTLFHYFEHQDAVALAAVGTVAYVLIMRLIDWRRSWWHPRSS
jgi:hypothetical protein